CIQRWLTSAPSNSSKTGWPINQVKPVHEFSYGIRISGASSAREGKRDKVVCLFLDEGVVSQATIYPLWRRASRLMRTAPPFFAYAFYFLNQTKEFVIKSCYSSGSLFK
ncbi:MAG: hypothetical protein FWD63_07160, partial [Propionibacteriaceae bacterium]|nr:hypothetical protein [Propionibacteriaceae bacterium]